MGRRWRGSAMLGKQQMQLTLHNRVSEVRRRGNLGFVHFLVSAALTIPVVFLLCGKERGDRESKISSPK